ncbi:hypothetical protein H9P43_006206 [Blastocladiella emersonii ATCC 22665]|nr:hypothetical protein H9P43_006206 [Blastocladiella emersonii ATCC 22665]
MVVASAKKRRRVASLPPVHVRVSALVYGPFASRAVIREHCYANYLDAVSKGDSAMRFEEYLEAYRKALKSYRQSITTAANGILKRKASASVRPTFPDVDADSDVRTLEFNRHWMLKERTSAGTSVLHPFLNDLVEKAITWREGNGFVEVEACLKQINKRMARAGEGRTITLHQLAPLIVVTIATLANPAIVSHLGIDSTHLPPLHGLYNEAIESLQDQDGVLDEQFVKDSRALAQKLLKGGKSVVSRRNRPSDVLRDARSGLPMAAFAKHGIGDDAAASQSEFEDAANDDDDEEAEEKVAVHAAKRVRLKTLSNDVKLQVRLSVLVYGLFTDTSIVRNHCYVDFLELFGGGESRLDFEAYQSLFAEFGIKFRKSVRQIMTKIISELETYLTRLNARTALAVEGGAEPKIVTLHQLAPLIVITIAVLTGLLPAVFIKHEK